MGARRTHIDEPETRVGHCAGCRKFPIALFKVPGVYRYRCAECFRAETGVDHHLAQPTRNEPGRGGPTGRDSTPAAVQCPGTTTASLGEDAQRRASVQLKHTPAPWHVAVHDGTTVYSGHLHTGVAACAPDPLPPPHIAGGNHFAPSEDLEERKANARLIAAAPTMYQALLAFEREVSSRFGCDADMSDDLRRVVIAARGAIRKAEGQS